MAICIFCYNFCFPRHSINFFWFCTYVFCIQYFVCCFCYVGHCNKTYVQPSGHSYSATYIHVWSPVFPLNVITAKRHYRYHAIIASYLLSARYYREIFPVPAVMTVVIAVLPLSPLPCHPLVCKRLTKNTVDICDQSNYCLCTQSHVACQTVTRILMSTSETKMPSKNESPTGVGSNKSIVAENSVFSSEFCSFVHQQRFTKINTVWKKGAHGIFGGWRVGPK